MGKIPARGASLNWGSFSSFMAMGGYGFYVWGSYLVTAILLAAEIALLISRLRAAKVQTGRLGPAED